MYINFIRLISYILIVFIVFIPNNEIKKGLGIKSLEDASKINGIPMENNLNSKDTYNSHEVEDKEKVLDYKDQGKSNQASIAHEWNFDQLELDRIKLAARDNSKSRIKEIIPNKEMINLTLLEKIKYDVLWDEDVEIVLNNDSKIIMGNSKEYNQINGVTCFRGNQYRDSASFGTANIQQGKLEILWYDTIGRIDQWSGVGWNGQPTIIQWSQDILKDMNINDNKKNKKGLKEVIYGALDGKVYFLDLEDGVYTREPIKIPGPIKGSVAIDPRGIPLLYVGQGVNKANGKKVEMGYRIFSLINQEKLHFINGRDSFAYRTWGAFDSTPVIDKKTDTMLLCGENGIFYRVNLNTHYDKEKNQVGVDPKTMKYRYKIQGNNYQGIENSLAVYRNLGYFADNGGWLQCIDLNTLTPIWIQNVTDDTDSTIVIEEEGYSRVSLYTACEVDKQGTLGKSYLRKLDAIDGNIIWEKAYECHSKLGDRPNNGGVLATPVLGKKDIKDLVMFNLARCGGFNKGKLVALSKETGEEKWSLDMDNYSWSSPVAVYTKEGKGYIVVCNSLGTMLLLEGSTGNVLDEISLGSNVEGSPAVFDDIIVVGTRGQRIYGVKIK